MIDSPAPTLPTADPFRRYARQTLLPFIGREGQARLDATHVALIGCGALGSAIADLLVRAGIGRLTLVDRDYVELHNLQRQSLFDETDVAAHLPKAEAAAARLRRINSAVAIEPIVADAHSANIRELVGDAAILVDGTDNFETRYLLNDLAISLGRPWVYGGVIGGYGMTMTVIPGETPCLRCVFPESPEPGSAPTCDTAGVFGPAVQLIAAIEASETIKLALGDREAINRELVAIDIWRLSLDRVRLPGPVPDCPACGRREFEHLNRTSPGMETVLCGHDAVQILPHPPGQLDLARLAERLEASGEVLLNRFLLRYTDRVTGHELTVFPDGRAIVKGTTDPLEARGTYAQFIGT